MRKFGLIVLLCAQVFSQSAVQVKSSTIGQLIIEVSIDSAWISPKSNLIKTIPNLRNHLNAGSAVIPYWEEIFIGLPTNAKRHMYRGESVSLGAYNPIISKSEFSKSENIEIHSAEVEYFNNNLIELSAVKDVNGQPATRIEIFPFQFSNGQLNYVKNFTIQITWNTNHQNTSAKRLSQIKSTEIFNKTLLNKVNVNNIPDYQFFPNIAKLTVDSTAWYKISYKELLNNGIDLSAIDPSTIRLWNEKEEIRIHLEVGSDNIFNTDDFIIFKGMKNPAPDWAYYDNNFYTNENVYWLTWSNGSGLRFSNLDVSPTDPIDDVIIPNDFLDKLKIEHDDKYVRLPKMNEYIFQNWDVLDHFFMLPEIIVSGAIEFEFELDSPDVNNHDGFDIEIQVRGMATMNHDLDVYVNNNLIGNGQWPGREASTIYIKNIDCSYLIDGTNTISFVLSPDDPSANDLIYLNWFELSYPRLFSTKSDHIKFTDNSNATQINQFEISEFAEDEVYIFKNYDYVLSGYQHDQDNDGRIIFQDLNTDPVTYELITSKALSSVNNIQIESPIVNILQDISSEYVIVAPDSFFNILEPLANHHNAEIVDIEDIYRQYSYGILSPYGLKSFLEDIYYQNGKNLKYVLFTMSCDEINWWNGKFKKKPSIPGMFVYTYGMGVVVSDYWYGSFTDDFWIPQVYIGRFPVDTKSELQDVVDKTMYHYTRAVNRWDNNVLLIGGTDIGFTYQNEALLDNIKQSGNFLSRLYVAQSSADTSFYGTAETLANHFSRGMAFINFFGHGGGRVWEDNGLLTFGNISDLNNGNRLPFIASMSCHTGDFSYFRALSRQMVSYPDGGALAWYSASGLGWYFNDYYMTIPLHELLFSEDDLTIGQVINLAKTKYYINYSNAYADIAGSQVYQYNLIGDPAIKLKHPRYNEIGIEPLDPEPNESVEIVTSANIPDSIAVQLFLPDNFSLNHSTLINSNQFTLDDTLKKGSYTLNVAYKSGNELFNSSQRLTISGSYINLIGTEPVIPTICDSINIFMEIVDRNKIKSAQLFVNNEYWSDMLVKDSDIFELENLIPPQPSGTILNIHCVAIDTNNDTTNSIAFELSIGDIPDISPIEGYFTVDDSISVTVDIESKTGTPVEVYSELQIKENGAWQLVGKDTINISGKEVQQVFFPNYYPVGVNEYRIITNANISCQTSNIVTDDTLYFKLETTAFWITPELGSTIDGTTHSNISIEDVDIEVQPGEVTQSTILQINKLKTINIHSQPDFDIIDLAEDYKGIEIIAENIKYSLEWHLDSDLTAYDNNLHQYFSDYQIWLPIYFSYKDDYTVVLQSKNSAIYSFLESSDTEKPTISANINDQEYLEDIFVSKNPNIQISVYDRNGLDFRSTNIGLNNLFSNDFEYEVFGSANNLTINLSPHLTELDSNITFLMKDAAGNFSDTLNISFIVSEKMDVLDYGNFPNPFSENTILAYELTETADELTIIIYSVDGRRIRKLTNDDISNGPILIAPGYHEVNWDGKNEDGFKVDNGNYFYQIRAKKNKKIITKNGKIVRSK